MRAVNEKLKLADAVRDTDRAKCRLAVAINNVYAARVDVTHARAHLRRMRSQEAAARRAVKQQMRREPR
jgi:hypothetical protein